MDFNNEHCLIEALGGDDLADVLGVSDPQASTDDASSLQSALDLPNSLDQNSLDVPASLLSQGLVPVTQDGLLFMQDSITSMHPASLSSETQNAIASQAGSVVLLPSSTPQSILQSSNCWPSSQTSQSITTNKPSSNIQQAVMGVQQISSIQPVQGVQAGIQPQFIQQAVQIDAQTHQPLQLPAGYVIQATQSSVNNMSPAVQVSTGQIHLQPNVIQTGTTDGAGNMSGVVNIQSAGVVNLSVNQVPQLGSNASIQLRPAAPLQSASSVQALQHAASVQAVHPATSIQTLQPAIQSTLQNTGSPLNLQGTLIQTSQGSKILIQHPMGQSITGMQQVRLPAASTPRPLAPVINVRQPQPQQQTQPQYIVQKGPNGQNIILKTVPVQNTQNSSQQVIVTQSSQVSKPQTIQNLSIQPLIKNQSATQLSLQQAIANATPSGQQQHILVQSPSGLIQMPIQSSQIQIPAQAKLIPAPTPVQSATQWSQPVGQAASQLIDQPITQLMEQPAIQTSGQSLNITQLAAAQAGITPQDSTFSNITNIGLSSAAPIHATQLAEVNDGFTSHMTLQRRTPTPSRRTPTPSRTSTPGQSFTPAHTPQAVTPCHTPSHTPQPSMTPSITPTQLGKILMSHQNLNTVQQSSNTAITHPSGTTVISDDAATNINSVSYIQQNGTSLGYTEQGAATVGNTITAPPNVNIQNLPQQPLPTQVTGQSLLTQLRGQSLPTQVTAQPLPTQVTGQPLPTQVTGQPLPTQVTGQPLSTPVQVTGQRQTPNTSNKLEAVQLSAQNHATLQRIQQQLRTLLQVENRTDHQQKTLQNLAQIQQNLLVQGRLQAIQSQQVPTAITSSQMTKPTSTHISQPQIQTPTPATTMPVPVITISNRPSSSISTPGYTTTAVTPATSQLGGLGTCTRTSTAVITSAGKITVSPRMIDPNELIKALPPQVRAKFEAQLAKMTPETRQKFFKTEPIMQKLQTVFLKKQEQQQQQLQQQQLQQQQLQQQQIQQQQLNTKVVSSSTPTVLSSVLKGSEIKPQTLRSPAAPITATTSGVTTLVIDSKGIKRTSDVPASARRIRARLAIDQKNVINPDHESPFVSPQDAMNRLLHYHIYQGPLEDKEQEQKDEEVFESWSEGVLEKVESMKAKYRYLLFEESMKTTRCSEVVMMERMFLHQEKAYFQSEKREAFEHPDTFKPLDYLSRKKNEFEDIKQEVIEIKEEEDSDEDMKPDVSIASKLNLKLTDVMKNQPKVLVKNLTPDEIRSQVKLEVKQEIKEEVVSSRLDQYRPDSPAIISLVDSPPTLPHADSFQDETTSAVFGLLDTQNSFTSGPTASSEMQHSSSLSNQSMYYDPKPPQQLLENSSAGQSSEVQNAIDSILTFNTNQPAATPQAGNIIDDPFGNIEDLHRSMMQDDINAAVESIL